MHRVIVNYIMWRLTHHYVPQLAKEFRDARNDFFQAVGFYTSTVPSRWRVCVDDVNNKMEFAAGRMYVDKYFSNDAKINVS